MHVDGYILPTPAAGTTQLYRLNYPALGALHHWTIDANEYNTLITPALDDDVGVQLRDTNAMRFIVKDPLLL